MEPKMAQAVTGTGAPGPEDDLFELAGALALAVMPELGQAYDILLAGGVPRKRAADLVVAAVRGNRDPVASARKYVRLRAGW
jgi:hypothetical protein